MDLAIVVVLQFSEKDPGDPELDMSSISSSPLAENHQVQQPFLQLLVFGYHDPSQAASPQKDSYGIHSYQKDHMFKVVEDWPPKLSILEFLSLRLISTRNIQLKNEMEDKHARSDKRWSKADVTPQWEHGPFLPIRSAC